MWASRIYASSPASPRATAPLARNGRPRVLGGAHRDGVRPVRDARPATRPCPLAAPRPEGPDLAERASRRLTFAPADEKVRRPEEVADRA